MGRGSEEARQRQREGQGRHSEQQRSHHASCASPGPAGAHPMGGPTGRGKGFKATSQNAAPTYGQGPSYTHHRGMGVFGMRALQLDDQADMPAVRRQQTIGARRLDYRGWPKQTSTGNTGQQCVQANVASPLRPGRGGQQSNREGQGARRHLHQEHGPGAGRGACRDTGKGFGVYHRGWGPNSKTTLDRRTGKAKRAAQDPRPKGARLDSAEAELRRHHQKMDSLTEQRTKLDEQIKECAESIKTAEDRLEEARQAWLESEADAKQDKKAQTIELNYEEFMHLGKMLEHFVGLTSNAGAPCGGSSQGAPSLQREIHWEEKRFSERPSEHWQSWETRLSR